MYIVDAFESGLLALKSEKEVDVMEQNVSHVSGTKVYNSSVMEL